jgi:VCBS repeat-containing protein
VGQNVTDVFTYTVSDGNGGTDTGSVAITVAGRNDSPTAQDGSFGTDEDTPIQDTLANLAHDPDVEDTLVFSSGSASTLGAAVTVNPDGTFTYDPTGSGPLQALLPGETADDTFSFTVSDGIASASAQVTVTVSGRNDPPTARSDELFVDEGSG